MSSQHLAVKHVLQGAFKRAATSACPSIALDYFKFYLRSNPDTMALRAVRVEALFKGGATKAPKKAAKAAPKVGGMKLGPNVRQNRATQGLFGKQ